VADDFAELAGAGEFGVDVGRVHVAGHDGEEVDVVGPQGADELGTVAHLDLVEGAVLDEVGDVAIHGQCVSVAMQKLHFRRVIRDLPVAL